MKCDTVMFIGKLIITKEFIKLRSQKTKRLDLGSSDTVPTCIKRRVQGPSLHKTRWGWYPSVIQEVEAGRTKQGRIKAILDYRVSSRAIGDPV